ncbi:MAG: YihY/virulence factor BrkB family protein [Pseudomonadota bacterium]
MPSLSDRIPAPLRDALRPAKPLLRAAMLWNDANGARMSASVSFYGILSLAPLLIFVVGLLGWWIDRDTLSNGLVTQVSTIIGDRGGALVGQALASAKKPGEGIFASVVGFVVLLVGATGVFGELQSAFERIWAGGSEPRDPPKWWHTASLRLRGIAYVLAFGFLLLVSLAVSTMLGVLGGWAGQSFPFVQALRVLNEVVAFAVCASLFYGLMRMSSGRKPRSRSLVFGAIVGATLFTAGRQVLALYLSSAAVVSAYGAAGSLVVLLMWIFFSSAILLYAAGCAKAVEETRQEQPRPSTAEKRKARPHTTASALR